MKKIMNNSICQAFVIDTGREFYFIMLTKKMKVSLITGAILGVVCIVL